MNNILKVLSSPFLNIFQKGGQRGDFLKMSKNLKQAKLVSRIFHTWSSIFFFLTSTDCSSSFLPGAIWRWHFVFRVLCGILWSRWRRVATFSIIFLIVEFWNSDKINIIISQDHSLIKCLIRYQQTIISNPLIFQGKIMPRISHLFNVPIR